MKTTILTFLLILTLTSIRAQQITFQETGQIEIIGEKSGLDSALKLTHSIPVYSLDTIAAIKLFKLIPKNNLTSLIESFMINFSLTINSPEVDKVTIINDYYRRQYLEFKANIPRHYDWIIKTQNNPLIALTKYKNEGTEKVLIDFYNLWQSASTNFESDYKIGLTEKNNIKKENLTRDFEAANHNCIKYLLALKEIKSTFYSFEKVQYHNQFVKDYDKVSENSTLYENETSDCFNRVPFDTTIIELTHSTLHLSKLNPSKEKELATILRKYNKSKCWRFMLINGTEGILKLGCQFESEYGFGSTYRVKLIGKRRLVLYRMSSWLS